MGPAFPLVAGCKIVRTTLRPGTQASSVFGVAALMKPI
jgi:hypothetical protein